MKHKTKIGGFEMKKFSALIGIGILCVGLGILAASFLPPILLICFQALLLILAGCAALK
jgi:hypothetical protein